MGRREAFNGKLAENRSEIARGQSVFAAFHVWVEEKEEKRERKPKSCRTLQRWRRWTLSLELEGKPTPGALFHHPIRNKT